MVDLCHLIADAIDRMNTAIGKWMAMTMLAIVLLGASTAILRYAFKIGYPWLSESFIWLNGTAFVLASAWVLAADKHVRVDVLYRLFSNRVRAIVNIAGTLLFLWPTVGVIAWFGHRGVFRSWRMMEASPTIDGLPFLYLLKTSILFFCLLLALQGIATVLHGVVILVRSDALPTPSNGRGRG